MIKLNFLNKIFGSTNERKIKALEPIIDQINGLEDEISKLTDDQLKQKTQDLKNQINDPKDIRQNFTHCICTCKRSKQEDYRPETL